jgi:hypothetical protein
MAKSLILHIGIGKTGTTSIQKTLFDNRMDIIKKGWLYPDIGRHNYAHHHFASLQRDNLNESHIKLIKYAKSECIKRDCHTMILSSEQFCYCRHSYINEFANKFIDWDVKVVFYIRRQSELIPSAFLQKVSLNQYKEYGDITGFFDKTKDGYDYNKRILSWEKEFGDKSIIVRLYDRRIIRDVCQDFITTIGLDYKPKKTEASINPSLAPDLLDFIFMLDNLADITSENRMLLIKELERLSGNKTIQSIEEYPPEALTKKINEYYKESNKSFANRYLTNNEQKIFLE